MSYMIAFASLAAWPILLLDCRISLLLSVICLSLAIHLARNGNRVGPAVWIGQVLSVANILLILAGIAIGVSVQI